MTTTPDPPTPRATPPGDAPGEDWLAEMRAEYDRALPWIAAPWDGWFPRLFALAGEALALRASEAARAPLVEALERWGRARIETRALRGRQDHVPTHAECQAAWARLTELEVEEFAARSALMELADVLALDAAAKGDS